MCIHIVWNNSIALTDSHPDSKGTKDVTETSSCCAPMKNNLGDEESEDHVELLDGKG